MQSWKKTGKTKRGKVNDPPTMEVQSCIFLMYMNLFKRPMFKSIRKTYLLKFKRSIFRWFQFIILCYKKAFSHNFPIFSKECTVTITPSNSLAIMYNIRSIYIKLCTFFLFPKQRTTKHSVLRVDWMPEASWCISTSLFFLYIESSRPWREFWATFWSAQ